LHHGNFSQFDIFWEASNKTLKCCHQMHILVKWSVSKVEPCMRLHSTSLSTWTCLTVY
jgi:hypothetical protein